MYSLKVWMIFGVICLDRYKLYLKLVLIQKVVKSCFATVIYIYYI